MGKRIIGIAGKVAGPKGTWRRRWSIFLALVLAVGAGLIVRAVHDTGAFELDGNAVTTTSNDWDEVCYQETGNALCGTSTGAGATATAWTGDIFQGGSNPFAVDTNATLFTGGGSKDPIDISQWAWKDGAGGLPDKDNLQHSFAARYSLPPDPATCPNGLPAPPTTPQAVYDAKPCEVLFFGSDRFDNSGDAQQGFWFFQNQVTLGTNKIGGGQGFSGVHKDGDLLVISEFSNGGTTANIFIYLWDTTVSGNLRLIAGNPDAKPPVSASCLVATAGDSHCGRVNPTDGTVAPWPFLDKSGNSTYLQGELFEAGINLSLLGLDDECFSSVMSETRSSTSVTAVLKDFVLGQFAVCNATLTTQAEFTTISPGASITDSATITVTSASSPAPTGTVSFFLCGPPATSCATTGTAFATVNLNTATQVGNAYTVTSTAQTPTAPGTYCFAASWPGDSNYVQEGGYRDDGLNECFTVRDTSSVSSVQKWLPNDTATVVSGGGSTPLNGTLKVQLYESGNCAAGTEVATQVYTKTLTNATSAADRTLTTNNSTYFVELSTSVSWKVEFTSTSDFVTSATAHCESTSLTITN